MASQIQANPIFDWTELDVWACTLSASLPFNAAYRAGFDRVGCAFCPNSGAWTEALLAQVFAEPWQVWRALLVEIFAQAGVNEPEEYVRSGAWKGRAKGSVGLAPLRGADAYDVASLPCATDECSVTYELSRPFSLDALTELLTPFGAVSADVRTAEVGQFHVVGPYGTFALRATPHWQRIRATFGDRRTRRRLEGTLRLQFRKLQACVGCGGCASLCPQGAITAVGDNYQVISERCTHCLLCVRGLKAGCRAADSLHARRVRTFA